MLSRVARNLVRQRLDVSPAVALVGPRQCGKTTLARRLGGGYFDLETEADRLRLDLSWAQVVAGDELVVLDEAQTWPEVFPRLRSAIDEDRKRNGRFLLLGSVSPAGMEQVSESLAGRLSLVELTPLVLDEVGAASVSLDHHWLTGGYPDGGVLTPPAFGRWQRDYLQLLAQRDLPAWGLPARPQVTQRLFRMIAALHAQTWNASKIGGSLGITYQTVNSYLDYLEGAFLTRRLQPFSSNLKKRLVKRPKVYLRDSGLLHTLLRVESFDDLLAHPDVGASWEGFVLEQTLSTLKAHGADFEATFFRTSDGYELDLVLDLGRERWAIETKLSSSPDAADFRRLSKAAEMVEATRQVLISRVEQPAGDASRLSTHLAGFLEVLGESLRTH